MHYWVLIEDKLDEAARLAEIPFDLVVRLRYRVPKVETVAFKRQMEFEVTDKAHIEPFHIVNLDLVEVNIEVFDKTLTDDQT